MTREGHAATTTAEVPARRLLAGDARHRACRGRPARADRSARFIDATNPFKVLSFRPVQDPVRPPDERLRQPDLRRDRPPRQPAVHRGSPRRTSALPPPSSFTRSSGSTARAARRDQAAARLRPRIGRHHDKGMAFWTRIWDFIRLEERLRAIDEGDDSHLPKGVSRSPLDDVLAEVPHDIRFHLSRGAAESFVNTRRCCIRAATCRCRTSSSPASRTTCTASAARESSTARSSRGSTARSCTPSAPARGTM